MTESAEGQILAGVRILDLSIMTAGPSGMQLLGDMGADIIKIEQPGVGDHSRHLGTVYIKGENSQYISQNRNKRSVTLNLRHPKGREVFFRLVPASDVVVENFRPGTVSRLGVDYEAVRAVKPDIIYLSISAFGQTGPYIERPANDPIVQAIGGLMAMTGERGGGPVRVGNPAPDFGAGALAAYGIMAALLHRHRTGQGQKLELSLLDTTIFSLIPREGEFFATGQSPPRMGSAHVTLAPYQAFEAADGRHIYISVFTEKFWAALCEALGHPEWKDDPRFNDNDARVKHRDELASLIQERLRQRPAMEWVETLNAAQVPCGQVNSVGEALRDPQVLHNEMVISMEHPVSGMVRLMGHPVKFSATPARYRIPPPTLGQHTEAVLEEAGLAQDEIAGLRSEGVI